MLLVNFGATYQEVCLLEPSKQDSYRSVLDNFYQDNVLIQILYANVGECVLLQKILVVITGVEINDAEETIFGMVSLQEPKQLLWTFLKITQMLYCRVLTRYGTL